MRKKFEGNDAYIFAIIVSLIISILETFSFYFEYHYKLDLRVLGLFGLLMVSFSSISFVIAMIYNYYKNKNDNYHRY